MHAPPRLKFFQSQLAQLLGVDIHVMFPDEFGVLQPINQWHTSPMTVQEQLAMDAAKKGQGTKVPITLGDKRYIGMDKMQLVIESDSGITTTVHYIWDPKTGNTYQFKILTTGMVF